GFLVVSVREDGPAIDADIRAGDNEVNIRGQLIDIGGDVIVGIDDQPVRKIDDILNYLARETEPGDTVTLEIIRNGDRIERDVTLQERP
ncbi:MAG: PDZ domain-containing protein, partial [Candidatus Nanohaloarchaeota archaeon QJJ-5]|nr:PDZ domain-containing protein [Candidatus Nanohaloarchaeota archaeon QJJ-5]